MIEINPGVLDKTDSRDEDEDVEQRLQRVSTEVIQELKVSVGLFIRKNRPGTPEHGRIRRFVRGSSTAKIERLIGTFQEWPQLLDPTLDHLVQPLVTAFVEYLQNHARHYRHMNPKKLVDPLPRAICKVLYTLCKVRGPKVITRFFSNEPAILEPMLDAFDSWNRVSDSAEDDKHSNAEHLIWEEKYIILLWLSHLALTPFDLASMSTSYGETDIFPPGTLKSLGELPNVAHRLVALGVRYLSSASKEREAAVSLLVRLSLRPDMQQLHLHTQLIEWILSSLNDNLSGNVHGSIYFYTGALSYLAGFFRSGSGQTVAPFLIPIFQCMQTITAEGVRTASDIQGSAFARKLVVKIHHFLVIHLLSESSAAAVIDQNNDLDLLNAIFDHLLTSLAVKDNPVRLAASKALSVIAQKLDSDMKAQLVDDIARKLQENLVFKHSESTTADNEFQGADTMAIQRNFTAVDPLNWHGLILTLSHLLFRHSAPEAQLPTIIGLIIDALGFEQRSSLGTSLGAGVRDAACFGIWSLARRYSTAELLGVPISDVQSGAEHQGCNSIIEFLAAELVLTATLDPEGNIRRGASAALQELVGRHPDIVPSGIRLIQIVDYHAVGLRSRAMHDVALQAAALDEIYLDAISVGMSSWRALGSPSAAIRRDAAVIVGRINRMHSLESTTFQQMLFLGTFDTSEIYQQRSRGERTADEWHGLYLAYAALIRQGYFSGTSFVRRMRTTQGDVFLLEEHGIFGIKDIKSRGKRSELAIEALCTVLAAVSTSIRTNLMLEEVSYHVHILEACFKHCTQQVLSVVKSAAESVIGCLEEQGRQSLIRSWLVDIQEGRNGQLRSGGSNVNLVTVVGAVLPVTSMKTVPKDLMTLQMDVLVSQLSKVSSVGTKCAVLKDLFLPVFSSAYDSRFSTKEHLKMAIIECLDDHTIDSRGDIGSDVRIAAIDLLSKTHAAWDDSLKHKAFGIVYGLAVEKLDRVRGCAWSCIRNQRIVSVQDLERTASWSTYNVDYFVFILELGKRDHLLVPMIRGFITSASVGSEVLVRNSRLALLKFLDDCSPDEILAVHESLVQIVRSEIPSGRLLRPGLEVLSFLLDVDLTSREHPCSNQWHLLLVDLPQVHTSSDLPTLQALVGVYAGLLKYIESCKIALSTLHRLLLHRYPLIRLVAAGALWMAVPNPKLKALDLSQPMPTLRSDVQEALRSSQRAFQYPG
ncbi:MAG: hypothetical protein Q9213_000769 [Squamulea squamosa]